MLQVIPDAERQGIHLQVDQHPVLTDIRFNLGDLKESAADSRESVQTPPKHASPAKAGKTEVNLFKDTFPVISCLRDLC